MQQCCMLKYFGMSKLLYRFLLSLKGAFVRPPGSLRLGKHIGIGRGVRLMEEVQIFFKDIKDKTL